MAVGITRLLKMYNDPTEFCEGAVKGDSSNIDMSVGDIYGGSYTGLGLPGNMIASSFGRLKDVDDCSTVAREDVAKSLLTIIGTNNVIFSKMIAQM